MDQMPNMKDLEYFCEIARTCSLTQTARLFGVSQPTVSYALKRLEAQVGSRLVTRNTSHHGLALTPSGLLFNDRASSILEQYRRTKRDVEVMSTQKIRLGLPPIIASALFPKIAVSLDHNKLLDKVNPVEVGSRRLIKLLLDDSLDMALLGTTQRVRHPKLDSVPLLQSPFTIAMSVDDELADQESVSIAQIRYRRFITLDENFIHEAAFRNIARRHDFIPDVMFTSNNIELITGMLRAGLGISFLARIAIQPNMGIITKTISEAKTPQFNISLVTQQHTNIALLDDIAATIQHSLQE